MPPTDGISANGKPVFNWDQAAVQLTRSNNSWSSALGQSTTVSYGFRSTAPSIMPEDTGGFQRFSAAQIGATEESLRLWSDVANISFTRVGAGASGEAAYTNAATMLFANYTTGFTGVSAFAYLPSPGSRGATALAGDVWVNISLADNGNLGFGTVGPHTLTHEIGHAIGLRHPGDYDGGEPTYATDAVYWQDARMFTVMSYFGSTNTGGSLALFSAGPQFHDIAAAQRLYGVNLSTRTGDTVYGFNSTSGHEHSTITSANAPAVFAIWDAGGVDTLDLSGYTTNSEIDLRAEAFSSAGPNPVTNGVSIGNIAIARGVLIENAVGGSGADTLIGNGVANALSGGDGADTLNGVQGADILTGGLGNDFLYGESSSDILLTGNALAVRRLYLATLDRAPDAAGWAGWIAQLDAGVPLATITTGFIQSPEFQAVYGALDSAQFVTLLYNNVLHRAPDPVGFNGWLNVLNTGGSRESVVNGFSQSGEFIVTSDTVHYGGQIYRLYGATLDRAPDPAGFAGWTNALANNDTLDAIAAGFVNSVEFQTVYGALDNTQFVTLLYANVLNRAPDPAGLNGWLSVLAGGASRTSVVLGFSESGEYQTTTRAPYVAFASGNFAASNDTLNGGAGDDLLSGGVGADTFVFTAGQGGTDTIYGLETIDEVQLFGFGYTTVAQAQSHLTQVGSNLVFSDQGQTIVFANFTLSNFSDDIWGLG